MASETRTKDIAKAQFTVSLASLASSTSAGQQSTLVDNSSNDRPAALVYFKTQVNATTSADGSITVYLIRGNDPSSSNVRTDNAGASDAALTIRNATPIGSLFVPSGTTSSTVLAGDWDTSPYGPLGPEWGIAVMNTTGQALHATSGNHYCGYVYYVPESQ